MTRRITALLVVLVLAGLVVSPADAAKKKKKKKVKKPIAVTSTQYLAWEGGAECAGGPILAPVPTPNAEACALFGPELATSIEFASAGPTAFKLDAAKPITVDFSLFHVASVAADFTVDVTATVDGKEMTLATGTENIMAAANESTPLHYELKPDAAANGKVLTNLAVTITWASGATFSQMEIDAGDSPVVLHGFK